MSTPVDLLVKGYSDSVRGKRPNVRAPKMTLATRVCKVCCWDKMRFGKTREQLAMGSHLLWHEWCSGTDDIREVSWSVWRVCSTEGKKGRFQTGKKNIAEGGKEGRDANDSQMAQREYL